MNLKIVKTIFKFIFIFNYKESSFSSIDFNFEGTFVEGLQCKYKLYSHVLPHPANNKSIFLTFSAFKRPLIRTLTLNLSLLTIHNLFIIVQIFIFKDL